MDDIQSWWEVPSIAHFCSLFRVAFNLLDFDIEELEEALLTDGSELNGNSLLQDLIVRLLCGCLGHNGISSFNYQMFLRRLFRAKCKEQGRENPFNTDVDFQFLPVRTKVEILHALCDFRLDADDVIDVLKNLDSDSLRVHPLGHDENKSAYWYFYGTRLYKEEYSKKRKKKKDHDKSKKKRKDEFSSSSEEEYERRPTGTWSVMCYTEGDWKQLARSMAGSSCREERALYTVLSEDFLPEIPRLFEEKERLQRKRAEQAPRRASRRLARQEEITKPSKADRYSERERVNREKMERRERQAKNMPNSDSESENGSSYSESELTPSVGRQTNNSLSSAAGDMFIPPNKQKFKGSTKMFKRTREDLMTGMYNILDMVKVHKDAWPFLDPVNEDYAPKYYSVIAKPMDLQTMEDKLDNGEYGSMEQFKADFQLIVDNCRQYNGSDNEYTEMVRRLQEAFEMTLERHLDSNRSSSEDDVPLLTHQNFNMTSDESSISQMGRTLSHDSSHESSLDNDSDTRDVFIRHNAKEKSILDRNNKVDKSILRKKQKTRKKNSGISNNDETSDDEFIEKGKNNTKRDLSSDRFDAKTSSSRDTSKDRSKSFDNALKNRSRNKMRANRKGIPKKDKAKDKYSSSDSSSSEIGKSLPLDSSRDTSKERNRDRVKINYKERETSESEIFSDSSDDSHYDDKLKSKTSPKKPVKKAGIIKNVEALEALDQVTEETLKEINRLLEDTPRFSDFSSCSNSPIHTPYMDDINIEGECRRRSMVDRPMRPRDRFSNDLHRRRMFKEQMGLKRRREIQRTIDRLQPGKSKGNLLSKDNQQTHADGSGVETKNQTNENDDNAPKISLGKVLPSDLLSFGIGDSGKKESEDDCTQDKLIIKGSSEKKDEKVIDDSKDLDDNKIFSDKVETKITADPEQKKKVNLSAWIKAFGPPKAQPLLKKKIEPEESRKDDNEEEKKASVEITSPPRRQRKTSTGSSVSEKSSFSVEPVDGNSPLRNLEEPYVSPKQEINKTYQQQPVNGTIKVGFYQDTCFPRGMSGNNSPSFSPREVLPSNSPRNSAFSSHEYPNISSPRSPYCSPQHAPMSPREYINSVREMPSNASPRDYRNCPRELMAHSQEYINLSPRSPPGSPKDPAPLSIPYQMPHSPHEKPIYHHYPSHLSYYETNKPIEYRTTEKNMSVYPVKKRAYNEIDNSVPKTNELPYKGGSFTPTREAMEQERTFTPTPGRMPGPSQGLRVPDPPMSMALPHSIHYDLYADERRISSPFYSGNQPQSPHHIFSQSPSVLTPTYRREPTNSMTEGYDQQNECEVLPSYHSSRSNTPTYPVSPHPDTQRSRTPMSSFSNRPVTPIHHHSPSSSPINYSNINSDTLNKEIPLSRVVDCSGVVNKHASLYNKPEVEVNKMNVPISFAASNRLSEVLPPKVSTGYNRTLSDIPPHGLNYNHGQDLSKMSVPLSYSNQSDLMSSKMNYNHPMAELMQSPARYSYPISEVIPGKASVYNHPMQDFMQGKAPTYNNMNLGAYNRPISEIMQSKVNDLQAREAIFSQRSLPVPTKSETPSKPIKKSRKKKNETPSGFQQYVAGSSEPISLKTATSVPGSAFNFGPPIKDSYGPFLDEIRSSFFVSHPEGSSGKGAPHAPPYYLTHGAPRTPPTYPHPFMNAQYQQYLQRHPDELLRPMMLHQGLLPPTAGYPHAYLGMHESINRPGWL